jgi:DNA-binding LytR/AlgR family response regulator
VGGGLQESVAFLSIRGLKLKNQISQSEQNLMSSQYSSETIRESMEPNVVDYLLKPFNYEEFLTAVQKAKKRIDLERSSFRETEVGSRFLFLKSDYKIRRINFDEILYIEGLKDYVKVYLRQEKHTIISLITMKSLESELPSDQFMRVHCSYIVNLKQISIIERHRIVFGETRIPVSDQYREPFDAFVKKNFPG